MDALIGLCLKILQQAEVVLVQKCKGSLRQDVSPSALAAAIFSCHSFLPYVSTKVATKRTAAPASTVLALSIGVEIFAHALLVTFSGHTNGDKAPVRAMKTQDDITLQDCVIDY